MSRFKSKDVNEERFKTMLREKGLKVTKQRLLVLAVVGKHPGEHLTAEEIYELVREQYPEIGMATIYRTVQVLVELNILDKASFDDGFSRYELKKTRTSSRRRHHHAICQSCGKVISFERDLLAGMERVSYDALQFTAIDYEIKIYGYCKACTEKKNEKNMEEST